MEEMKQVKGFFSSLFDLSFTELITARVVKVLYIIAIVLAGLSALTMIGIGMKGGVLSGIALLIISPLFFLLWVIVARIWLEVILVLFRIEQNTRGAKGAEQAPPKA